MRPHGFAPCRLKISRLPLRTGRLLQAPRRHRLKRGRFCHRVELLFFFVVIGFLDSRMEWSEHISRRLKLRQLEVLIAVARWGNMAKAAEELAITQPVVSKTIADLEET